MTDRPTLALAGASGFVGSALRRALADEYRLVGLSRRPRRSPDTEWRVCDLYSLLDVEQALEGCDVALYLVHSMLPSARLTQGSFADLDLVLADNFARAAAKAGVKHIVYLGGLVPDLPEAELSPHLRSRLEVERALGAHGVPVTALRAGLVVGAGGSSLHIMVSLVKRLPAMVTPAWTASPTQPIALEDVIRAVRRALPRPEEAGVYDIGGPDVMSYREMMARTARVLGKRRPMLPVPLFTPELSTLWVTLVTGAPRALVGPLVQSLRHAMVARPNPLLASLLEDAQGFEEALRAALDEEARASATPRVADRAAERREHRPARTVRSVQRLPRPAGLDADDVARAYLDWLPRHLWPVLRAEREGDVVSLGFWGLPKPLLELTLSPERSTPDRALFYVSGGLLARTDGPRPGRLEFRRVMGDAVLAAIHDFQPALPWPVYKATQALAHLEVMHAFGRHLRALERAPTSAAGKLVEARP